MARGNIASQATKIKQGRGEGRGKDYIPWHKVREVPSLGLSTRTHGKTGSVHHLLSQHESRYYLIQEYNDDVIEIRDQYPLPIEVTTQIAEDIGIKHPRIPASNELAVMTTDFLLTVIKDGEKYLMARAVKPSSNLKPRRVREKLEIERLYWESQGIDWKIVTERELDKTAAQNIRWLLKAKKLHLYPNVSEELINSVEGFLFDRLNKDPKREAFVATERAFGLRAGTALFIMRYLLAVRRWRTSLSEQLLTKCLSVQVRRSH